MRELEQIMQEMLKAKILVETDPNAANYIKWLELSEKFRAIIKNTQEKHYNASLD